MGLGSDSYFVDLHIFSTESVGGLYSDLAKNIRKVKSGSLPKIDVHWTDFQNRFDALQTAQPTWPNPFFIEAFFTKPASEYHMFESLVDIFPTKEACEIISNIIVSSP